MVLGLCVRLREYGLGPVVVGSEATCPCSSAGVAARARMQLAVVRRDSGPPRKCLRQSYAYNTQAYRYQVGRSAPLASTAASKCSTMERRGTRFCVWGSSSALNMKKHVLRSGHNKRGRPRVH